MADAEGDLDLGFSVRTQLVRWSYRVPGSIDLLAAYSWLIARSDEDPQRFRLQLWNYKWVVNALPKISSVSRTQVESVLDDLGRRFEAAGSGPAAHASLRLGVAIGFREPEATRIALDDWLAVRTGGRDALEDCGACNEATHVTTLVFLGEDERALEEAQRLIDGRSWCSDQPHWTLPELIAPARRLKRKELANDLYKRGYKLVREKPKFVASIGYFIRDSLEERQLPPAVELIAKHRSWLDACDEDDQLAFLSAARVTFLRFDHFNRSLPDSLADMAHGGRSAREVADAMIAQAEDLASRFDERNGNTWHADKLAADLAFATR